MPFQLLTSALSFSSYDFIETNHHNKSNTRIVLIMCFYINEYSLIYIYILYNVHFYVKIVLYCT